MTSLPTRLTAERVAEIRETFAALGAIQYLPNGLAHDAYVAISALLAHVAALEGELAHWKEQHDLGVKVLHMRDEALGKAEAAIARLKVAVEALHCSVFECLECDGRGRFKSAVGMMYETCEACSKQREALSLIGEIPK
jgi:hypothetical protein